MPLFLHKYLNAVGEVGIWHITENEQFFLEKLELHKEEAGQLALIKGHRRLEWLASRHLVHLMSGRQERGSFLKDEFGKPHLIHSSFHISISHSHHMSAAIAAPNAVGIDVQFIVGKIDRIAHKFMRPEEMKTVEHSERIEHLHVYWGAKEALYKAYGRRKLDFCNHILINPFSYDLKKGICFGKIVKDDFEWNFDIFYEKIEAYILVYALKK